MKKKIQFQPQFELFGTGVGEWNLGGQGQTIDGRCIFEVVVAKLPNVEERVMGPGTLKDLVEGTCHHGEHGVDLAKPRTYAA